MLRCSSSEEERERRAARRAEINQERATYVQAADMEELRKLVAQSRRIEDDPHNKMHGRTVEDWHQDERSQMPRRRRNKPSKKPMDSDEEEAAIERARREMMRKITGAAVRGEHAAVVAAASMQSSTQSGSGTAAAARRSLPNAWNDFQHEYGGRQWGSDKFRAEYWKFKATGKRPA